MCRYGFTEYKNTYACFKCRKGFKRRLATDLQIENVRQQTDVKCPHCSEPMRNLGKDLRLPVKDAVDKWSAIEFLAIHDFNFFTCGCHGIGVVPQNLEAAKQLVEVRRIKTDGELLLDKFTLK